MLFSKGIRVQHNFWLDWIPPYLITTTQYRHACCHYLQGFLFNEIHRWLRNYNFSIFIPCRTRYIHFFCNFFAQYKPMPYEWICALTVCIWICVFHSCMCTYACAWVYKIYHIIEPKQLFQIRISHFFEQLSWDRYIQLQYTVFATPVLNPIIIILFDYMLVFHIQFESMRQEMFYCT